jgi:hypothetical protein
MRLLLVRHRSSLLDLAAVALLVLIVTAFFWPLVSGSYWIPKGGGDLVSFIWPMYRFSAVSLRSGQIPLWNPHVYGGAPFVADNQSGVFYPVNLLAFALAGEPSYGVIEVLVVFHMGLAAVGMFTLMRSMGLRRPAAVFGGVAFGLSDLFVTHIGNLNLNATAAWMPWLLFLTHRALAPIQGQAGRPRVPWALGAGTVFAVAALAGHAQMLLFSGLMLVSYVAYRLIVVGVARGVQWTTRSKQMLTLALLAALTVAVGIGGASLTLLPGWEMAQHTGRGQLSYEEATRYSLPPKALVGLLAPGFYGRGETAFWGGWDRVEVGYAGAATLVCAALGIGLVWVRWLVDGVPLLPADRLFGSGIRSWFLGVTSRVPSFPGGFFLLLIVVGFVLAMGRYTPVYWVFYRYVPTLDQLRVPARLIVLADLGLVSLAAYGIDGVQDSRLSSWVGMGAVAGGGAVLGVGLWQVQTVPYDRMIQARGSVILSAVFLGLSGGLVWLARRRGWGAWMLVAVLAADLIVLGSTLEIEPNDPTLGYGHEDVVAFLHQDANLFRIESSPARAWQPDAALVHGLYDIDGVFNPLGIAPYHAYRWASGGRGAPLYDLMAVKYVLANKGQPPGDERLVPVYNGNPDIDVFLNTQALPMALLVYEAQIVPDHEAAWRAVHAEGFDPTRVVVLEEGEAADVSHRAIEGGRIEFVRYDLNALQLAVEVPADGWLVLSEVYFPGWRAAVDGERVDVLRADYTFRAVPLSSGSQSVRLWFAPPTWYVGLALSGVTWMALAVWATSMLGRRIARGQPVQRGEESGSGADLLTEETR